MKKFFISPLFCLALVLAMPLHIQGKVTDASSLDAHDKCGCNQNKPSRDAEDKCGCNANKPSRDAQDKCGCNANKPSREAEDKCGCNANKPSRDHELVRFIGRLAALDEDESSPLHQLNDLVQQGEFVVSKDDFVAALDHAQAVIVDNNNLISDEEIEQIGNTFNALVDVVTQASDSATRDCSSACDDDSALKIRKILSVLNKAIFCDVVVFRNEAIFLKHVEMQDSLSVRRLYAHKAKIDKLKAKKAKIKHLETDDIETCDLTVDCNIFVNDSISPAVGNIYKGGDRFLHNFGVQNTFVGDNAGNFTMTGSSNAGFGDGALFANTIGTNNVAIGSTALQNNTTGTNNTATGQSALLNNTTGNFNTASGQSALLGNTTGSFNTASGAQALNLNTTGEHNVAVGFVALQNNATGDFNTALGDSALQNSLTGSNNIAVGAGAGSALTGAESDNIYVGNAGVVGESGVIRIGNGSQTTAFMAGINPNVTGSPVVVTVDTVTGQLGIIPSSIRYKENVQDMNEASALIFDLRPVTFTYKVDETHARQFGLIAEEVNEVIPDIVVKDGDGQIQAVQYHKLSPLLLNELIKINARLTLLEEQVNY